MKLKCIGGFMNGHIQDVDSYLGEHDMVKVMGVIQFNLPSFEEDLRAFREGKVPDYMTVPYHYYTFSKQN